MATRSTPFVALTICVRGPWTMRIGGSSPEDPPWNTKIRNPKFLMFRIDEYPCRISQASLVSFDDSGRSDVATLISRPRENKDRLIDVVRDVQIAGLGIHGEVAGPIQLGPVTLNHAQWRRIAGRVQRINRNRRRIERGRAEVPRL